MKPVRYLAAGLLFLSGMLHLGSVVFGKFEATSIITIVFGLAYLVIGFFLLKDGRTYIWYGAILPLVGLVLAVIGMLMKPNLLGALFIVIDIIVPACCLFLIIRKE